MQEDAWRGLSDQLVLELSSLQGEDTYILKYLDITATTAHGYSRGQRASFSWE